MTARRLILASGSTTRRDMLHAAGIAFEIVPADVDEPALRRDLVALNPHVTPQETAAALAVAKAMDVGGKHLDALVIGADQILDLDGEIFAKPTDIADAGETVRRLSGRTHALHSAVALVEESAIAWTHLETAHLTMRTLSPAIIDDYIARAGPAVCQSVGAYQIEGLGIQLFKRIDGDHFTILGMPLLALLAALRTRGALAA